MFHSRRRGSSARARRGFTIVELLVAIILAGVGLLALAGAGGIVAREVAAAASRTAAALLARNRVEWFASTSCASAAGAGIDSLHHAHGDWRAWREGTLALLRDSVLWQEPGGAHAIVVHSARAC